MLYDDAAADKPHLGEALTSIARSLSDYVVPIFQDDERGFPEQLGSGLLIKHLGKPYIATASHVLSAPAGHGSYYFYSSPSEKRMISGAGFANPKYTLPGAPSQETHDLMLVPLLQGRGEELRLIEKKCLPSQVLSGAPPNGRAGTVSNKFLLTGFPISRGTIKRDRNEFESLLWPFYTHEATLDDYKKLNLNPHTHLLLALDSKDLWREGRRVAPPKLNGCSGCPIWFIADEDEPMETQQNEFPRVVAIATFHPLPEKFVYGVRTFSLKYLLTQATTLSTSFDINMAE
jgi:hypothetical protein